MPHLAVVTGAIIKCDKGASPSVLQVTTPFTPVADGRPVSTIFDNKPLLNVLPFGVCAVTKVPCVPVTPLPWVPGETTIPLPSKWPVLSEVSLLPCMVGGIIKIQFPGQTFLYVNAMTRPGLSPDELVELLGKLFTLGDLAFFAKDMVTGLAGLHGKKLSTAGAKMWGLARSTFRSAFGLNLRSFGWRFGQVSQSWKFAKSAAKLKVAGKALKALGPLGLVVDAAFIASDVKKGNYRSAAASAIGVGAGVVCGVMASPTVVGVAACAAVGVAAQKIADYAIKNPKKALEAAAVVMVPGYSAAKWVVANREEISRAAGQAKDAVVETAGKAVDAADKAKDAIADKAKDVGGKLKDVGGKAKDAVDKITPW
ncbi:MAG TPA: DUF4280 domain-containing protein [Pyrinomonadaceae bacterium]|nr:DUF4280 domain-containing protein [Pyrinomonadaceae bacterium]